MPKVLLIEDDQDQITMYEIEFSLHGIDFINAKEGEGGIALAKSEKPDLILVDLIMEGIGGLEVLERLKRDKDTTDIPVVILTNLETKETLEKAHNLGALEYIVKTRKTPRELREKVLKIIEENK